MQPVELGSESIGCTPAQIRLLADRNNLPKHARFVSGARNLVKEVTQNFQGLLKGIRHWEYEQVHPVVAELCLLLLVEEAGVDVDRKKRCSLLFRFLQFIDSVEPMRVHYLVLHLLAEFEAVEADHDANLLHLAHALSKCSWRGRPLAVCLLWELLRRRLPSLEITMHRYRELGELAMALSMHPPVVPNADTDDEDESASFSSKDDEKLEVEMVSLLILLEAIEQLLYLLLFGENDELIQAGYPEHFFHLSRPAAECLYDWSLELGMLLPPPDNELAEKLSRSVDNLANIFFNCKMLGSTKNNRSKGELFIDDDEEEDQEPETQLILKPRPLRIA
ncbi:hypothetical protein KR009_012104 [Drosophila setifemur]|nr:hypothetical protein KR009_012104 [Drosophila setifemur]